MNKDKLGFWSAVIVAIIGLIGVVLKMNEEKIVDFSKSSEQLTNEGLSLLEAKDYPKAITKLSHGTTKDSKNARGFFHLAVAEHSLRSLCKAKQHIDKAVGLEPNEPYLNWRKTIQRDIVTDGKSCP